jgi:hypothetical protein
MLSIEREFKVMMVAFNKLPAFLLLEKPSPMWTLYSCISDLHPTQKGK